MHCFWTVFACKQCLICAYFSPDRDETTFSLEKALLWRTRMVWSQERHHTNTQFFSSQDVNWWTGVMWILSWCFYQLFWLSFWRHPFTAEHPFLSKWCNATFLQIWWRNKLILIFNGLRVSQCSAHLYFWVNIYHKCTLYLFKSLKQHKWVCFCGRQMKMHVISLI